MAPAAKALFGSFLILNPEYTLANLLRHPNLFAGVTSLHFAPSPLRYDASFVKYPVAVVFECSL
jgi:hypothetical protein